MATDQLCVFQCFNTVVWLSKRTSGQYIGNSYTNSWRFCSGTSVGRGSEGNQPTKVHLQ